MSQPHQYDIITFCAAQHEAAKEKATSASMIRRLEAELSRLHKQSKSSMGAVSFCDYVHSVNGWLEAYRNSSHPDKLIRKRTRKTLLELRDRIKLAAEELGRIEDEGGIPATASQNKQLQEINDIKKCVDELIPGINELLNAKHH